MSFIKLFLFLFFLNTGCENTNDINTTEIEQKKNSIFGNRDFKEDMRSFVIGLSEHAKGINPEFAIIPQNGIELVTKTGTADGAPSKKYLEAIDGNGQENLFYGYKRDNVATKEEITDYNINLLKVSQNAGNSIFVIDYCSSKDKIEDAYQKNYDLGFIPFVATKRDLTLIPPVPHTTNKLSNKSIASLEDADNFLFILNYEDYDTKNELISEIDNSNYDVVFLDMFFNDGTPFSKLSIEELKTKPDGGRRQVICYMSIGEAEDYRYYWDTSWKKNKPIWLDKENKNWKGNFKVRYWEKEWQNVIFGNDEAYLDKILSTGFDGVYLDIIDAFEYFENYDE
ncbi:endo alpha-1,4 polygalactosaminidase [uncultured Maribacter sp.]|uniref:endo alpha-1,4 polygalactosaminidase n=1 Tax=uncultured Maribacter sp. TaxID=431308 RepID=UPI00262F2F9A|nr:endo alpha-1,4 polygalactosaminidase [uncultured Maribacter sp.]